MSRISYLSIQNFRSLSDIEIELGAYAVLVGRNNSGKTSVLRAVQWLLSPYTIEKADLHQADRPLSVAARVSGVDGPALLTALPELRGAGDGKLWIRRFAQEPCTAGKSRLEYAPDQARPPTAWMPCKSRETKVTLPDLLPQPLLLLATDDLQEDLGKSKSGTTLRELLSEVEQLSTARSLELERRIAAVNELLKKDELVADIENSANKALQEFFPGLALKLELNTIDFASMVKSGTLLAKDADGQLLPLQRMGGGAQRSVQMALVRYLAESMRVADEAQRQRAHSHLLLVDEPDLYLHPRAVRQVRETLAQIALQGWQVVATTHSPVMICQDNIESTVIMGRVGRAATAQKPAKGIKAALSGAAHQGRVLFQLENVAAIYFSDLVVLCEGKTDGLLLPQAYECHHRAEPGLHGIAFIQVEGSGSLKKTKGILDGIGVRTVVLADLDFSVDLLDEPDKAEVQSIFREHRLEFACTLDQNGLPKRGGGRRAEDGWSALAASEVGRPWVERVHAALLSRGYWVWPSGAIEDVLAVHTTGDRQKGEEAIAAHRQRLAEGPLPDEIVRCLNWVRAQATGPA